MKHGTAEVWRDSLSVTFNNSDEETQDPKALYNLSYGLFVVSTKEGDIDNGCICNTCFQVGVNPDRLVVSSQMENLTREMIEKSEKLNVSVLTENVPFETIRHFGMQSGRDTDKFKAFEGKKRSANGIYYLTENTNAVFSCEVEEKINLGSHMMFVCRIISSKTLDNAPSCTYAHYHKAIKPKI